MRRKTHEEFVNDLKKVTSEITILGNYVNSKEKIKVKCNRCDHEWAAAPSNLLNGNKCPKCTGIYKKTTEDYKKELSIINDKIEVIGEYIGARDKIKVKCKICNHIWEPAAGSLLAGHGCPKKRLH